MNGWVYDPEIVGLLSEIIYCSESFGNTAQKETYLALLLGRDTPV